MAPKRLTVECFFPLSFRQAICYKIHLGLSSPRSLAVLCYNRARLRNIRIWV